MRFPNPRTQTGSGSAEGPQPESELASVLCWKDRSHWGVRTETLWLSDLGITYTSVPSGRLTGFLVISMFLDLFSDVGLFYGSLCLLGCYCCVLVLSMLLI